MVWLTEVVAGENPGGVEDEQILSRRRSPLAYAILVWCATYPSLRLSGIPSFPSGASVLLL